MQYLNNSYNKMSTYNINLSNIQKRRINTAFKKQRAVRIKLSADDLKKNNGKDKLILSSENKKQIDKCIKKNKGIVLELTPEQLKINHEGGFLPLLFAGIGAVSAAIGGIAAAASTVKDWKHKNAEEEETHRHNTEMEKLAGKASTLSIGAGVKLQKKRPQKKKKKFPLPAVN